MSNHYHVVLHVDRVKALAWSFDEVIERRHRIYKPNTLSERYVQGEFLGQSEREALSLFVDQWRKDLMSISCFNGRIKEIVARKANYEDQVTGSFWERRFNSQALLDDKSLLACMAYVDLNPIRAGMAQTPETSEHTSIRQRIHNTLEPAVEPERLFPFVGNQREDMPTGIAFSLNDYLELVDWTGRIIRQGKKGAIPENLPPLLQRLNMDARHWVYLTKNFEKPFTGLVGAIHQVRRACEEMGKNWVHGRSQCEKFFSSG